MNDCAHLNVLPVGNRNLRCIDCNLTWGATTTTSPLLSPARGGGVTSKGFVPRVQADNRSVGELLADARAPMGDDAVTPTWEQGTDPLTTYGQGCTRSSDVDHLAYDIIPACAERREAARWGKGERSHGRCNWQLDQPIPVIVRHLRAHLGKYMEALEEGRALDESARDDHLAAMRCGLAMLMWYEEHRPELFAPGEWQRPVEAFGGK